MGEARKAKQYIATLPEEQAQEARKARTDAAIALRQKVVGANMRNEVAKHGKPMVVDGKQISGRGKTLRRKDGFKPMARGK